MDGAQGCVAMAPFQGLLIVNEYDSEAAVARLFSIDCARQFNNPRRS
ncbi:MAG: hypothetical protein M0Q49_05835 [Porticoccaceae bacterium]|nr:hypothetical protein [Porticoccaceae bacterium]